ncbi:predicted protein [Streptomyces iranensis]|uniref:Uncharacterized protein n=1 Tax=Streptomyces iranensis TaxID=576784 RepID=A0A061A931_9ACTN|nr:predicted protein [Streptomyces iranensis]
MRDEDDRGTGFAFLAHECLDVLEVLLGGGGGRLVQQQDAMLVHLGTAERHHLTGAGPEPSGGHAEVGVAHPDHAEGGAGTLRAVAPPDELPWPAAARRAEAGQPDVLLDAEGVDDDRLLVHKEHSGVQRRGGGGDLAVVAVHDHPPTGGALLTGEQLGQRRLAGAIRTADGEHLTRVAAERDVGDGDHARVDLSDPVQSEGDRPRRW